MQVLEDEDGGIAPRDLLDEAQPGGEVLVAAGRWRFEAEQRTQPVAQPLAVLTARDHGVELGLHDLASVALQDAGVGLDDLAERPKGDVLAVGQAVALPPRDHLWQGVHAGKELLHQTTLADARFAEKHGELGSPRGCGLLEQGPQEGELDLTADERRELGSFDVDPAAHDRRLGQPGGHRFALPLAVTAGSSSYSMAPAVR